MSKPTILAVDDDPEVLASIARDLRSRYGRDYRLIRASSGAQALEVLAELALRARPVALVVSDQRMPEMTGVEMLAQARPHAPDAKFLLLTAYADTDAAIQAINDVGLDYYLLKPWDPPDDRLYPVVDDLLGDWRASHPQDTGELKVVGHRWSRRLIGLGDEVVFAPGDELWTQGEPADSWWVLLAGRVDLVRTGGHEETLLGSMDTPGRWAGGFRAWDEHGVYLATGRATAAGRALRVGSADLKAWTGQRDPFGAHLIEGVFRTARTVESAARQRDALVTLGTLAAGLAHELNNPAAAATRAVDALGEATERLLTTLGTLAAASVSAEQLLALDALRRELSARQSATGADPMALARQQHLRAEAGRLGDGAVREVRAGQALGEPQVVLDGGALPGLPARRLEAIPGELNQVWTNLISNALDAMGGQGRLRLAVYPERDGVVVEVGDSGTWTDVAAKDRAFEPFFTTKGVGQGTGLGLDISRRIVVGRHGGDITIDLRPGETVLRVWLPRRHTSAPRPGPE